MKKANGVAKRVTWEDEKDTWKECDHETLISTTLEILESKLTESEKEIVRLTQLLTMKATPTLDNDVMKQKLDHMTKAVSDKDRALSMVVKENNQMKLTLKDYQEKLLLLEKNNEILLRQVNTSSSNGLKIDKLSIHEEKCFDRYSAHSYRYGRNDKFYWKKQWEDAVKIRQENVSSTKKPIDPTIFRRPPDSLQRKGDHIRLPNDRFIGLDTQRSEMAKEFFHVFG